MSWAWRRTAVLMTAEKDAAIGIMAEKGAKGAEMEQKAKENGSVPQRQDAIPATIKLKDIKKLYPMGDQIVAALAGIDLTIRKGEFAALMGPSGSNKSTLNRKIGRASCRERV